MDETMSGVKATNGRILFLSYCFPPLNAIASVRTWNIAKQLARHEWTVTVVTPSPPTWRRAEEPEYCEEATERLGIRILGTGHRWPHLNRELIGLPRRHGIARWIDGAERVLASGMRLEPPIGWLLSAADACRVLRPGSVDVVLASGWPFCTFYLAHTLAQRLHARLVLDYRDLWIGNPHRSWHPAELWEGLLQASILRGASAVTTVSSSCGAILAKQGPASLPIHVLPNGFDSEELAEIKPAVYGHPAIVYTGSLHAPKRTLRPVLAALATATAERRLPEDWRLHYYGASGGLVRQEASEYGLQERVVDHGFVSRKSALAAMKGSMAAVVVVSVLSRASEADQGILTGKLFEAIGLGARILAIAPIGSDIRQILGGCSGHAVCASGDISGIQEFFVSALGGQIMRPAPIAEYEWERLGVRWDELMRAVDRGRMPSS